MKSNELSPDRDSTFHFVNVVWMSFDWIFFHAIFNDAKNFTFISNVIGAFSFIDKNLLDRKKSFTNSMRMYWKSRRAYIFGGSPFPRTPEKLLRFKVIQLIQVFIDMESYRYGLIPNLFALNISMLTNKIAKKSPIPLSNTYHTIKQKIKINNVKQTMKL